ncbi:DUF4034 domain-containing protein [Undibacterium sp. Ji50W]|uniref:DUF4034 domain-containing protein n=1 Tax=Undibacterium sp. Ji50W TaxID=3413041 RepID=UPI003BF248FC
MPMNLIRFSLFAVFISCLSSAAAQQDNFSINSFTIKKSDAMSVTVEVDCNNDGSKGRLLLGASVNSRDGTVRTSEEQLDIVPIGKNVKVAASFRRPPDNGVQKTDVLRLHLISNKEGSFLIRNFDMPYVWEATSLPINETDLKYQYWQAFRLNFDEGKFAAIDQLLDKLIRSEITDTSGTWQLSWFDSAVNMEFSDRDDSGKLKRIQQWKVVNPKSTGIPIAEATYWRGAAWRIRGNQANVNVDPFALKLFKQRMDAAELALSKSKKYASRNPTWYEMYLLVSNENGKSLTFSENLYQEAIKRHPRFTNLYKEMALIYAPPYGLADWAKVEKVIETGVKNITNSDGAIIYATIYQYIASRQQFEFDIFRDSLASWPRIKQGYEHMLAKTPNAKLLNEMAVYACRANDKDTFNDLWTKIQGKPEKTIWPANYTPDICTYRFKEKM